MKKQILSTILTLVLVASPIMASASTTGWIQKETGEMSYLQNDAIVTSGLAHIDGDWYCFDSLGNRDSGWVSLKDGWHYFNNGGEMLTGWFNLDKDWYYLDNGGKMLTGDINLGGTWYKLDSSGKLIF